METMNQQCFNTRAKQNRAYHYMKSCLLKRLLFVAITFVPFLFMLFLGNGIVSQWITEWAGTMMYDAFGIESSMQEMAFIPFFKLRYLSITGCMPSHKHIIIAGIISIIILLVVYFMGKGCGPFTFFMVLTVIILLFSTIFFYFWGDKFPYLLTDFSRIYMTQQLVSWLAVGFILSLVSALYSKATVLAIVTYYGTLAYCFVIGSLRYLFYLVFLHYASNLYMVPLFFTLGVFWDFLFVVCVFSIFSRKLSSKYKKRSDTVWQY